MKKILTFFGLLLSIFICCHIRGANSKKAHLIDLVKQKKPFYTWATGMEISWFNPLGYYRDLLKPAPYVNLKLRLNPRLVNNLLFDFEIGLITAGLKNNPEKNYKLIPIGISFNYLLPLWKNFGVAAKIGFGEYFFMLPDKKTYTHLYTRAGLSFQYKIASNYQVSLQGDFLYFIEKKKPISAFNLTAGFTFMFGTPLTEKDIKIVKLETRKIFASLYPYYYKKPIGTIKLKNTSGNTLKNIKVSLFVKNYMDGKTPAGIKELSLKKNMSTLIPLYVYFNENIKNIDADTDTTGILEIEYQKADGGLYKKRDIIKLKIFGKNALVWDNLSKLGSFISLQDKTVLEFARKAVSIPMIKKYQLPKDVINIIKIIQALKLYKLKYVKDPRTAYSYAAYQGLAIDYVQYPRETLQRKTGDCDDLTVLIAALMESIGISTAFVTIPGHVFLLIEAKSLDMLKMGIDYKHRKWIPLETTVINKGFTYAWEQGYRQFISSSKKDIKITQDAVSIYQPLTFKKSLNIPFLMKISKIKKSVNKEIMILVKMIKRSKIKATHLVKLTALELNKRAISFCKAGEFQKGEKLFLKVLEKNKKFRFAYFNLFKIYGITNQLQKALILYHKYNQLFPNDGEAALLLSKLYISIKNYTKAQEFYNLAIKLNPSLKDHEFLEKISNKVKLKSSELKDDKKWFY